MDDVQKKLGLKLQQLGLSYQTNGKHYYQKFFEPESLFSSFKEIISKIEESQIDDKSYLEILTELISEQSLSQFKRAEIFEAWIIYQIKATFGFAVSIDAMLQIIRNHYIKGKFDVELCLQKIANKNYPKIKDRSKWKNQQKELIHKFVQKRQTQIEYFGFNRLFKNKQKKEQSSILDKSFTIESISAIVQIDQSSFQSISVLKQCFPEPQISNINHHFLAFVNIKNVEKQLSNVFKGVKMNYQCLDNFFIKKHSSPRIFKYVKDRLKLIDQRFFMKINHYKGITISIKNQLVFQYIRLINEASIFYIRISTFISNLKQAYIFRINIQQIKSLIEKFLAHFESLYLEVIKDTYQLQLNSIQQKISSFFIVLETMFTIFFSKQYEELKTNVFNIDLNVGLSINWPSFKGKPIIDCIWIIIQAIRNKLSYIFTEFGIDYRQISQVLLTNRKKSLIVQSIFFELKKCDQHYFEQINGMKKYFEDITFEDQDINYLKKIKNAYIFANEITRIKDIGKQLSLKVSIQYLQSSFQPFVQHYQRFYKKILQNIYKLKYKSIPQNIQLFFSNLEQLTSKLLPKDYQKIKSKILKIPLNQDFQIQYDINQQKSITYRILRINQVLIDEIANDFTKVLDIFNKPSKKYYDYLSQEQKKRYLHKLREYFEQIIDRYKQQAKDDKDDCEKPFADFFTLIPDSQTRQLLQTQFQMIKIRLANAKKQVQDNFSRGLKQRNFNEIVKYFKQMNSKDRAKNKSRLKQFINRDFESIFDQSISKKQLLQQYQQLCSKYQKQTHLIKQLSTEYSIIKKQAKDRIAEGILFLVEENKAKIQQNDYQQIGHLTQNNQNIIHAYKYFIDNDKETSLRTIQKIENYFETVLSIYRKDIKSNQKIANMHKWEFSEVQKLIRQQFCLRETAMPIMNQLTQYKNRIKQFKISEKIQIMLSDQHKNQFLSLITWQIILFSKQVSNFSFLELFKKLPLSANEQAYREQLQFLFQKIALISKIEPAFKQYGLDKIQIPGNTRNISNLEPFKQNIVKEIKSAIQQTQLIKQNPQKQLPRKLICLSILCQLISKNKDMQIANKLESIYNELFKEISDLMGGFLSQIQLIKTQPSKKKGLQTKQFLKIDKNFSNDSYHIQRAQATINKLIVAQKMQLKLQLFSQFIKEKSMQIMKQIQKNRNLLTVIIHRLKIKESPEIKKIINKYQMFKPALDNFNKNEVQKKDAKLLFEQFKAKNQINEHSQYTYQDYLDFVQSYNETLAKYLQSPSEITTSDISNIIRNSISNRHKNQVIGKLLGLYAILKRNQLQQITFQPYPSQFLCISLLLQFGQPFSQMKLNKNIVSMLPGEGKTIALAITACFLVLKGYKVYPICQSEYLAHESQQHFKQLFQALKIKTAEIKYHALDQFCEQIFNPGSTKQLIKNQLLGQVDKQQKKGNWLKFLSGKYINWTGSIFRQSNKVILIDQINIIFSEHFEDKVYEPIIEIKDEGKDTYINNIFEYIYNRSKTQYLFPKSITKTNVYQDLIGKYSRISQVIRSQIAAMLNDVLDEQKINEYYQEGKQNKKLQNNKQNKNSFTGYQQSFAYLKLKEEGFASQKQIKNKLKLYIKIGQYSVSQLFRNFDTIIGVGSTLECLSQKDKILLNEHYKIQNIYFIPPIFEYRNIAELTSICQGDLHQKIVKYIKDHFQDRKQKSATIIFFKDQRSLYKFAQQAIIQIAECQGLKINSLLQQNEEKVIERVTSHNCLTLATKQFARGYNYKDNNLARGLCVIQTYLPSNTYELQQAKGRTARQGRPGIFNLFIPIQELELIDRGVETYLKNIKGFWREINQKDYYRRQVRRKQAKQKHNIIQYEQGGRIISYLQKINKVQFKPIEGSILIVFGISQNFINLTDWLLDQLQRYQDLIKKHQIRIKLRYQICYYGNYTNYTSKSYIENFRPHENILRAFKIRQLYDLKEKLKNIKPIEPNVINQQESMETFLSHVLRLSQRQTVRSCFIWGSLKNYSWSMFKRTNQFRMHESSIRKQLSIQQDMKTPQQYIALIQSKKIIVNCRTPKINQQKNHMSKQFELYFREKMRQAMPYLKNIVIQ